MELNFLAKLGANVTFKKKKQKKNTSDQPVFLTDQL